MKPFINNRLLPSNLTAGFATIVLTQGLAFSAQIAYKTTNAPATAEATLATNWVGDVAPGPGDVAAWMTDGDTVTAGGQESRGGTLTFATPVSYLGMRFEDAQTPPVLTGSDITLGATGIPEVHWEVVNIQNNIILAADQPWAVSGATLTVTGGVSGIGGLLKSGTNVVTLSGTNSFTGPLAVQNGTLRTSSLAGTGGTLTLGGTTTQGILIYEGPALTISRAFDLGGTTGGGTLTREGLGTLTLTGPSTATGAGAKGVTVNGSGDVTLPGFQSNGGLTNITKSGVGTLTFTGSSAQSAGAININGGIVSFPSASSASATTFTRPNTGGILRVSSGSSVAPSNANTNGILGSWAVFDGNTWAVTNGASPITGLATFATDTWAAGNNTDVTAAGADPAAAAVTNSLRFNEAAAKTVTLSGQNTLSSGGVLMTGTVGTNAVTITGGSLVTGSAGGGFNVTQNAAASTLTIGSVLGLADSTQAGATTTASTTATVVSTAGLYTGMAVTGTGVPGGTTLAAIGNATTITLSAAATATGTPNLTFASNNSLMVNGPGTTVLTAANVYTAGTTVLEGTLEVQARGTGVANYTLGKGATLRFGYAVSNSYNAGVAIAGTGVDATTGLYLQGGKTICFQNNGGINVTTAPTTIRTYGTGNAILSGYDTNGIHLTTSAAASGTVLASTIDYVPGSFGYVFSPTAGTNTATGDVIVQGLLTGTTGSYRKLGTGSVLLTGASTATNPMDIRTGSIILGGGDNRLAVGSSLILGNGTGSGKLMLNGISQTFTDVSTVGTGTANRVTGNSATLSTLTVNYSGLEKTFAGILGGSGTNENNLAFVKNGPGSIITSGASTSTGLTTVNAGSLEVSARAADAPYTVAAGAILKIGYTTGANYANTKIKVTGLGTSSLGGLYLKGGSSYNASGGIELLTLPTTIRQYGTGLAFLGTFDVNGNGITMDVGASGSIIDQNIQIISRGYGMSVNVPAGSATATGDLVINGPLNAATLGFYKRGNGSVALNSTAYAGNAGLKIQGGTVITGADNAIGAAAELVVSSGAKLVLKGFNQEAATLSGAGSIVNTSITPVTLTIYQNADRSFTGALGGVGTNDNNFGLFKAGSFRLSLEGTETYTGSTTVDAGTLAMNTAYLPNTSDLIVTTGAILELNTGTTDVVRKLLLDGMEQPVGVYGALGSGAQHEVDYIIGDGTITVPPADPYASWETLNGITGAGPAVDSDNDGIPNGIEFVIGGDPSGPNSDSNSLLQPATVDGTYMNYVFRRTTESAGYTPFVEYSTALASWAKAVAGINGVLIVEDPAFYGAGIDRVTVRIPLVTGAHFARLNFTHP
ncbi:MAG: autotransporter-associated beta strand repeat-containing protein [Luteolibacter sp.]|uniref:beta strand repeat-containing protein n=1 Tax=Luteolibacter sp. TaxID=1962973 RepID=UPI0032651B46